MIDVGLVGLGKMGISHQAILNAHPKVKLAAVCDSAGYMTSLMSKYTGVEAYTDFDEMLQNERLDAVVVATPPDTHVTLVEKAISRRLHVFCEKPFVLEARDGERLVAQAEEEGLVTQVGYHNRFVGAFVFARALLRDGVLGDVHHVRAEAQGPVVLRPQGSSWRATKRAGGGALFDYASHVVDLLCFCVGRPDYVRGASMRPIFSADVEDEIYAVLEYANGSSAHVSVNWSDESQRKMATRLTIWGTKGKLIADRQEVRVYLREDNTTENFTKGWNVRYTTELTEPVDFYLRGEEYSAQIDHFVSVIKSRGKQTRSSFQSALETDHVLRAIRESASAEATPISFRNDNIPESTEQARSSTASHALLGRVFRRIW